MIRAFRYVLTFLRVMLTSPSPPRKSRAPTPASERENSPAAAGPPESRSVVSEALQVTEESDEAVEVVAPEAPSIGAAGADDIDELLADVQDERGDSAAALAGGGQEDRKKPTIPAEERAGRPRGNRSPVEKHIIARPRPPDLVCERHGGMFTIGFELDVETQGVVVRPTGEPLPVQGEMWIVSDSEGAVWRDGDGQELALELSFPIVFELTHGGERGRRISRPSFGMYLIVAPEDHELELGPGQHVTMQPGVKLPGRRAWEVQIDFDAGGGLHLLADGRRTTIAVSRISPTWSQSPLGVTQDNWPVFGRILPDFELAAQHLDRFACVVIGREGTVRRGWRERLGEPDLVNSRIHQLLDEQGPGWYFLRIYREADTGREELEHSQSFWYLPNLNSMFVDAQGVFPSDGPEMLNLELGHDAELVVRNAAAVWRDVDDWGSEALRLSRTRRGTATELRSSLVCDAVDWCVVSAGFELILRQWLPRVWWSVGEEGSIPEHWGCEVHQVSPSVFRATSTSALLIRVPAGQVPREVRLLFETGDMTHIPLKTDEPVAQAPLRDIEREAASQPGTGNIQLVVIDHKGDEAETLVLIVKASFTCRTCNEVSELCDAMEAHAIDAHWDVCAELETDYARIRGAYVARYPERDKLPEMILECANCAQVYGNNEWTSREGAAIEHFQHCPNNPTNDPTMGDLRIIRSVEEIRKSEMKHILENVGDGYTCRICGTTLLGRPAMESHLLPKHRMELYDSA